MAEQGTDEWLAERAGKFTASTMSDLFAVSKRDGKPLEAYGKRILKVATERLMQSPPAPIKAAALSWGNDTEPYAKEQYELTTGYLVENVGFIQHPQYEFAGCSPDGLVGLDRGVEIKSPYNSENQIERFLSGIPEQYMLQIQTCLWVTGRKEWDFVSFDARLPDPYRLLIKPVPRDDALIAQIEEAVIKAEAAVQDILERLRGVIPG